MQKKSFTLIEMLIVVVIIGILAAALIPRLQSVQARARDTKRKADLHQIATALAIYKEDNGGYLHLWRASNGAQDPLCYSDRRSDCDSGPVIHSSMAAKLTSYMTAVPEDTMLSPRIFHADYVSVPNMTTTKRGYVYAIIDRHGKPSQGIILGARTESDGSSSNWTTNTSELMNAHRLFRDDSITPNDGTRAGGFAGGSEASLFEKYMCNTVTLSGSTNNDGSGTCIADKNADDLRYIYVQ